MKEITINKLSKWTLKELQPFLVMCANRLYNNWDFKIAESMENSDISLLKEWGEEAGHGGYFRSEHILGEVQWELYHKIMAFNHKSPRLKKAEIVELLAEFLNDPVFSEYMFYTIAGEKREILAAEWGVLDELKEKLKDKVFLTRDEYLRRIEQYYIASMNLYGVLTWEEFTDLVYRMEEEYAATLSENSEHYIRQEGLYQDTLMFNPMNLSRLGITELLYIANQKSQITFDQLILHPDFEKELEAENEALNQKGLEKKVQGAKNVEEILDIYKENFEDTTYRRLAFENREKAMYQPIREELLKYLDSNYMQKNVQALKLTSYLVEKYNLEEAHAEEVVSNIRIAMSDNNVEQCLTIGNDFENRALNVLEELLKKQPEGKVCDNDVEELLTYISAVKNTERCWYNHGNSPIEGARSKYLQETKTTSFSGSGVNTMPLFGSAYKKMNEQPQQKKIYPNDPCPCGSGKKYKKCCGR